MSRKKDKYEREVATPEYVAAAMRNIGLDPDRPHFTRDSKTEAATCVDCGVILTPLTLPCTPQTEWLLTTVTGVPPTPCRLCAFFIECLRLENRIVDGESNG